ncbi:hypothetical protein N9Y37_09855 [Luminiphilus sp.]|nr:hypothetical protein [Luminiphilus sp.]
MINPEKDLSEYANDIPAHSLRFLPEAFIVDGSGTDKTLSGRQKNKYQDGANR